MPTYDYECNKCHYVFELFQSITAKPQAKCPKCRSKAKRLIGAGSGLIFKGSGFYITDYKRNDDKRWKEDLNKGKVKTTPKEAPKESKSDTKKDTAVKPDAPKADNKGGQ